MSRRTFTDRLGNEWDLTVTLGGAERIENADWSALKIEHPVSFFTPKQEFFNSILIDTRCIAFMVWCLIKPQADKLGILHHRVYRDDPETGEPKQTSPIDAVYYEDLIDNETIGQMKEVFWDSVSDFFRERGISMQPLTDTLKAMQKAISTAMEDMQPKLMEKMHQEINNLVKETQSEIDGTNTTL
jgi:gas vesicle protein